STRRPGHQAGAIRPDRVPIRYVWSKIVRKLVFELPIWPRGKRQFSTKCLICNILLRCLHCPSPSCYISAMNTQNQSLSRKILIVDDDPRLRELLRRYLYEQGFNVFVAEDAKEMGKLWQREHFDLLVLDLMLPGEDGLSICRRLRGGHDNTPIIIL